MTRIAETVPELWFNRCGYMTVRGLKPKEGHGEIDLLAYHPRKKEAVHVETSASLDLSGFLGGENAANIAQGIKSFVAKKYDQENIRNVRENYFPEGAKCIYMLVHGKLNREEEVREALVANHVIPVSLHKILRELQTPVNTEKVPFEVDTDAAYFAGLAHYYHLREFQEEQKLLERAKAGATVVVSICVRASTVM